MPKLYRKRFIPDEIVELKDDRIVYHEGNIMITEWDALEDGSITEREIKLALRNLDSLLQVIYSGGLPEMIHFMEEKV